MNLKTLSGSLLLLPAVVLFTAQSAQARTSASKERLIAEVARLGGTIEFDESNLNRPIVKVDLHGTAVTDNDLRVLETARKDLTGLRILDLRLTKVGDQGVARLKNLTSLQTLNLFRTQLGDEGLADLRRLTKLETLLIGGTKVTDAGLVHLKPFTKLRKLSLFQTHVSDQGIAQLKRMASLEVLLISGSKISPAGAEALQKALPKVRFSENITTT